MPTAQYFRHSLKPWPASRTIPGTRPPLPTHAHDLALGLIRVGSSVYATSCQQRHRPYRTIRAFGLEGKFVGDNNVLINTHTVPFLAIRQMQRWLNLRMNVLGAVVSFAVAIFAVATAGFISVPWVAVALTYAMRMTGQLTKVVQAGAEVEVSMNSIERIKHYSDNIVPEGTAAPVTVPDDWPRRGDIDIRNLSVRYRENKPLVLKDVSAKFAAGERVGVCGRTGSGKSTLLKSVFRINEAASGAIYIDGVDISRVPLPVLRSRVATIPQVWLLVWGVALVVRACPAGMRDACPVSACCIRIRCCLWVQWQATWTRSV